jgi:parvulin-like peptidyl-prolyl isomerase
MFRKDAEAATPRRIWKNRIVWTAGGAALLVACLVARNYWGPEAATAQAPGEGVRQASATTPANSTARPDAQVVATVNGKSIYRQTLADACIARFGKEVLESLVNKHLIAGYCQQHGIEITRKDIDTEIARMAKKFSLGAEQWLALLERERGILPEQYARDIIWPTLALRRLAANRLTVSDAELQEAYDAQYGPAVQVRMIAVSDIEIARRTLAELKTQPDSFAKVARDISKDINSASTGGLLPPIRRHVGNIEIEKVVFGLQPGQISPIVRVGELFAIFRCEQHLAAAKVPLASVQSRLEDRIREDKLRDAAGEIFQRLQQDAVVENVMNDPQLSRRMPGVAASVNGRQISLRELGSECIARHGEAVLEGLVNRALLEQQLKQSRLQVTEEDIAQEIAHAAKLADVLVSEGQPNAGQPDVDKWIRLVTEQQKVSADVYIADAVWPSAALKKLVHTSVKVTQEDQQKGFDANYGPRVRCRAIIMNNMRRAQEVWDKARNNPTVEYFGQLAAEYSIEPTAKHLYGEVPPIKKHGGQPLLEAEAFKLKPGDLSGVIQLADKYVILFCEGYTQPIEVDYREVQHLIHDDLFEKKLRIAMAKQFEQLVDLAQIDNYLAGTSQSPKAKSTKTAGRAAPATQR